MPLQISEHLNLSPYFVDNSKTPGFDWESFQYKIENVPETIFNILVAEDTSDFIKKLTQEYPQLSASGPDIARIVRDVILADLYIGDMPVEISKRLGVDQNTGREIANQIVSQLFTPALDDVKKMQATKFPDRVTQRQATLQVPPQPMSKPIPGAELPETGGNVIDLRNQK